MSVEKKELFKSIECFENNRDLFINFAFFQFIKSLGRPLLKKIEENVHMYSDDYNLFFNNLKVKCDYEKINDEYGKYVGYLKLKLDNNEIGNNGFDTYIYSKLVIHGKEILLNGQEDRYDSKTSKIILSKNTLDVIHKKGLNGGIYSNCEIYYNDKGLRSDPTLNSLINLYLNNKNSVRKDYKEKINDFERKVRSVPKYINNGDTKIFEIDENGNNRIKYENLQKGEIYFLQGPPGTGKTYAITRLIEEIIEKDIEKNKRKKIDKIIVSSSVHVAINNVIEHALEDFEPENKYHKFYDLYQYLTVLYSNRALSKIKDSPLSELIELDKIIEQQQDERAEYIYKLRKGKSKELINDFDEKLENLKLGDFKTNISFSNDNKLKNVVGEKFKRIFTVLNSSGEKYIDYEKSFELINELSDEYNRIFTKDNDIDWAIRNYSSAIKNYSNVIFCTLSNLHREIERQKKSDWILVIIDEASKSDIINYLLLLNNIENITLLVIGDPKQLNQPLVFDNKIYSQIMTAFTFSDLKNNFLSDNYNNYVIDKMKKVLFDLIKYKSNRQSSDGMPVGYEFNSKRDTMVWKEILSQSFYEKLFDIASDERKELLYIHRRSRKEIFELSKDLYPETYIMGNKEIDNDLLIPSYDVLTRIVVNDIEDSFEIINKIVKEWQIHKSKIDKRMTMGIITSLNEYIDRFKGKINGLNNNDISLYTIDSSQGDQFTTVIFYLDLNPKGMLGFLKEYQRINVAISRAKEQLIIIETKSFIDKYNDVKNEMLSDDLMKIIDKIHNLNPKSGDIDE